MKTLVTGGCGFIGSNFVRLVLQERPEWSLVNIDALTYAGNLANLADVADKANYKFIRGDIADAAFVGELARQAGPFDAIINFAAESHVDRSVLGPDAFVRTNINGTFQLLELARKLDSVRYVQISTDEVYGALGETGKFKETTPINPSSPYSATKASADHLVQAYHHTYGLDTVITRCSNNYGPYQFPEKLIPLMVLNAREGKDLPVYGNGKNVRDWIYVEDHCRGILAALEKGESGEVYNFGGEAERANIDIVQHIADKVAGTRDIIQFVKDRPGHDWRYAMDISKVQKELAWAPQIDFEAGLERTITWYLDSEGWWRSILSGDYQKFYDAWYGDR